MSRPVANLRLFVAAYPPEAIVRTLVARVEALPLPAYRLTPPAQVHLTLQFVGDTPARALESVIESAERSAAGLRAFELRVLGLVALPERGPARLLAARTDEPATLLELHRRLAHRLATNARERPGDRFAPHLTLCRFVSPAAGLVIHEPQDAEVLTWRVEHVLVMRSTLRPEGAEHHVVRTIELEPGGE